MPRQATVTAPASLPPAGLPGLDPQWSRLVEVPARPATTAGGAGHRPRTWHVLDNAAALAAAGVAPTGTILCVHGNPTWSYLWRRLVERATATALAGGAAWRVVAVDQLDMGFSERTGAPRTLPDRVADLGALTDELGLDGPVVTLGHDWGGVVSLGWAVDHPELLSGLMLLNTAIHQPDEHRIPAPLRLTLAAGVLGRATVSTTGFLDVTLALAHPRLDADVKRAYRAPYLTAARRGGIGGFVADIPVDADHPSHAELDRIAASLTELTVPALMLWGPRDPIFSDRYLDDLVDRLPHADVHRFEGAGHLVAEDVDYAEAVLTWLGDRDGDPTPVPTGDVTPGETAAEGDAARASSWGARSPLWARLDELAESDDTAVIEMAPPGGGGPRTVSWRLLARRVDEIAFGLRRVGVQKGDRVSLLVPPGADLTAVLYACVRIGAVVVVADAGLGLKGLTRAVTGAYPQHVIGALPGLSAARALGWPGQKISTTRLPRVTARLLGVETALADVAALGRAAIAARAELPTDIGPDEVAAILFTSGSTGPAKGVVYRQGQLSALRDVLAEQYDIGVGTGLVAGFAPFALLGPALGATSVTPDMDVTSPKTLTARAVAAAAAAVDATVVFLSPAAIANVVATSDRLDADGRRALAGVETFLSAGAPVSESLLAAAGELMPNAVPHTPYGMTEGLLMTDITLEGIRDAARSTTSTDDDAAAHAGGVCVGTPGPGVRVSIAALDDRGRASSSSSTEPGVTGEIVVSAPHLEDHYDRLWLTDRASRRRDAAAGDEPRTHRTGDVGHLDAEGRLWVEGRLPHVITTAHGVVTPVGPEQRVEGVGPVRRAAVVGIGPVGTQQIAVIVESTPPARRVGLAPATLAARVREAAGVPVAAVLVVPELPTDVRHNSKIDRSALSRWATGVLSGERMTRP
ncbi:alpha/beta fold hydrolase [Frigoribacterium sp. 2-23]|uniref:alpha/beta fold hydrolase n=1 Tax=Frigoribacterium sp. 2-23 TaxID=3415006 RepID=UPI003C703F40